MKNKYSKYILGITIFYFVWLLVLPIGISCTVNYICKKIDCITVVRPRIATSLLPNVRFRANEIKLYNPDSSVALYIKSPKMNLRLFPLLIGKIHLNSVEGKTVKADFRLSDKLYLGQYPIDIPKTNAKFAVNRVKFRKINLDLSQNKEKYSFRGNDIYYKSINHGKGVVLSLNADLLSNGKNTSSLYFDVNLPNNKNYKKSKFNIDICEFKLSPFSKLVDYFTKEYPNYEIVSTDGLINIHSDNRKLYASLSGINIKFKDKYKNMVFPDKIYIQSHYRIGKNNLKILNTTVDGKNVHTAVSGRIKNYLTKKPDFDLEINMPKSDVRAGAMLLPPIITEDVDIPKLKEYPFYGDIIGSLKVKGAYPEPDIFGKVQIRNGVLIRPIPNAAGAKIDIEFIGKKFLLDVHVPAGGKEVVDVDGSITVYGEKFANLNVKTTNSVSLAVAEFALNPIHDIFRFILGPVPIMKITGLGNANLKIVGTKRNPHVWGDFNFKNAGASFNGVRNMTLEHADGNLHFDNQDAHFINRTGTLHGQKATVDGTCKLLGDLDFNVTANNQNLSDLYKTLSTSPMLSDMSDIVPKMSNIKGKSDLFLNLTGHLIDINDLRINENVIPKGFIKLKGNSFDMNKINIWGLYGIINFDKKDCDFNLKSHISKSSIINIEGKVKDDKADVKIVSPRLLVNDFDKDNLKFLDNLFVKLNAKYKGKINKIDYGGINANVEILPNSNPVKKVKIISGKINLKNAEIRINNLKGRVRQNPFGLNIRANIKNIDKPDFNISDLHFSGNIMCRNFDLTALNYLIKSEILPKDIQKELGRVRFKSGRTTINAKASNSRLNGNIYFTNTELTYMVNRKVFLPLKFSGGQISMRNNSLKIERLIGHIDDMPVMIYGNVSNILRAPKYKVYVNSKLIQHTFDKYWNAVNIYPIKINGDILLSAICEGTLNHADIKSNIKMEADSYIYYMGATFGDINNPNSVYIDADYDSSGLLKLNRFKYNKLIKSQNNRLNIVPVLSVKGAIKPVGNIYEFKDLCIKTDTSANADFFNIIFKKPTIKSGTFTSDLRINGNSRYPKILGKFHAVNINMPYLNTNIKDINVDFEPSDIKSVVKGKVLDNYIMISSDMKNKLTPPYKINKADIYINDFDINRLANNLKQIELKGIHSAIAPSSETMGTNIMRSLLFDNMKIRAGNVKIKNIKATNFEADCSLNNKMKLSINPFKFNMANGRIVGEAEYNLLNNHMKMEMDAKDVNANTLSYALFDIQNQIFGSLTGHIDLSCNAYDEKTAIKTLNGSGTFNVAHGRMPKLGSLEYLLRAGNFLKGGITSLSMNGILDIMTPMKTGEFTSINGRIRIKDGIAKTIEINTLGKNLNLYMIGSINLYTSIADMHIFGQLSRRASTILGAVGNISLNTLFNKIPGISLDSNSPFLNDLNKIPGIELSSKATRKFMVKILGDINSDDFVKSFRWIN